MLKDYEINSETVAIIPINKEISKIIEDDDTFLINQNSTEIIDKSCKFFGSSYHGRFEGTKCLIGVNYKAPIIIEESREIIFFPTSSPRFNNCSWICLSKIDKFFKNNKNSIILFKNGYELNLDISYSSLENQILRSTLLESTVRNRKKSSMK